MRIIQRTPWSPPLPLRSGPPRSGPPRPRRLRSGLRRLALRRPTLLRSALLRPGPPRSGPPLLALLRPALLRSRLARDVALVCLADGIVAVSVGATSVSGGLPWWVPVTLSLLVFAGGSQIAATGVVLAGGSPVAAVAAGALLNTRLFPYSLAVADVVAPGAADPAGEDGPTHDTRRGQRIRLWAARLLATHVITDESVAFTLQEDDPARRRGAFWTCGLALFAVWNVAVVLGVLLGSSVTDTNALGLDATFPAVMLALALPTLTDWRTRLSAGTGAVIAVALTPVLPAGLPVLAALAGLASRWRPRSACQDSARHDSARHDSARHDSAHQGAGQ